MRLGNIAGAKAAADPDSDDDDWDMSKSKGGNAALCCCAFHEQKSEHAFHTSSWVRAPVGAQSKIRPVLRLKSGANAGAWCTPCDAACLLCLSVRMFR